MLLFTKNHLWVEPFDSCFRLGLSNFAVKKLNKILFLDFTVSPNDFCNSKNQIAIIESIKIVWEITAPFPLKVGKVNLELAKSPEILNTDPECENAWLISFPQIPMNEVLMNYEQFKIHIAGQ